MKYTIIPRYLHIPHTPDAINDNRFFVVTVLMVIWDYSHQKEYKSNEKTPAFRHF